MSEVGTVAVIRWRPSAWVPRLSLASGTVVTNAAMVWGLERLFRDSPPGTWMGPLALVGLLTNGFVTALGWGAQAELAVAAFGGESDGGLAVGRALRRWKSYAFAVVLALGMLLLGLAVTGIGFLVADKASGAIGKVVGLAAAIMSLVGTGILVGVGVPQYVASVAQDHGTVRAVLRRLIGAPWRVCGRILRRSARRGLVVLGMGLIAGVVAAIWMGFRPSHGDAILRLIPAVFGVWLLSFWTPFQVTLYREELRPTVGRGGGR